MWTIFRKSGSAYIFTQTSIITKNTICCSLKQPQLIINGSVRMATVLLRMFRVCHSLWSIYSECCRQCAWRLFETKLHLFLEYLLSMWYTDL